MTSLLTSTQQFLKLAQTINVETTLVDKIKNSIGKGVMDIAAQYLNSKAVSSIPIRINFARPKAEFVIDSVGADANVVNTELKSVLDKKFGGTVSHLISSMDKTTPSFNFGLFTVE